MKIETQSNEYILNASSIDRIAEQTETFLYRIWIERANLLRIRLSIEEALLRWQERFGEDAKVLFITGSRWRIPFLELRMEGEGCDPLANENDDLGAWSETLLSSIGLSPRYSYQKGVNVLHLRLRPPRRNPAINLLVSLAVGLIVGVSGVVGLPESTRTFLIRTTLDPIQNVFFRILNSASGPVIFCTVLMTICGVGTMAVRRRWGRKLFLRFLLISLFLTAASMLISALAFSLHYHDMPMTDTRFSSVLDFFLQIIPNDVLSPVISGDSPQLILIAAILGNAILVAGNQSESLVSILEQIDTVALIVAEWVGRVSPFFIAILLILGIWDGSFQVLAGCWKAFLLYLLLSFLFLAGWTLWVALTRKVPLRNMIRNLRHSFLVALRTASIDAAFGDIQFCCEKRLGIKPEITSYALPVGTIVYMPSSSVATIVLIMYVARSYGIVISGVWCVTALFLTVALVMASPPVAGVGLLGYAAIFARLGIPSEGLTVALMADILFGFACTAVNQAMLELELVIHADREGQLDLDLLRRRRP